MFSGYTDAMSDALDYAKEHEPKAYKAFVENTKPVTVGEVMDAMNCTEKEAIEIFHASEHIPPDCTRNAKGIVVEDNEDGTLQVGISF